MLKRFIFPSLLFYCTFSHADVTGCPSVEQVRERSISQEFDWTVSEDVTLHSLLNVDRLYFVSIENHGEFLACSYDSETLQLRLDGKPIKVGCVVKPESEHWFSSVPGQSVCLENDKNQCRIKQEC